MQQMSATLTTESKQYADRAKDLYRQVSSCGRPVKLLLANRTVYHEALASFLRISKFYIECSQAFDHLLKRHADHLHHIRTIILDQESRIDRDKIASMLKTTATQLPNLRTLDVDVRDTALLKRDGVDG